MELLNKLVSGLKKTRDSMSDKLSAIFTGGEITAELYDELEEAMILSDMGAQTAIDICQELRSRVRKEGVKDANSARKLLASVIAQMMGEARYVAFNQKPGVILMIGVNGTGKTTTAGKLAYHYKQQGQRVVLGAADTFRAAAIQQLEVWAQRSGAEFVAQGEGADPAAVVYDAIAAGKARGADLVLCDTAGRLHNKKNLMDELKKIVRIATREVGEENLQILLVLDAATGQNAISQAKLFQEAAGITGLVLTKLDGTAKGGVVVGICHDLQIPVYFIGVGEQTEDLRPFDPEQFAQALFV